MSHIEQVAEEVRASGRRTEERLALWEAIVRAFEAEGAEAVQEDLVRCMGRIRHSFDGLLGKLEDTL